MTTTSIATLAIFGFFLLLAALRFAVRDSVLPATLDDHAMAAQQAAEGESTKNYNPQFQEVIQLGDVTLTPDEQILAACGQRGEVESVLLATNVQTYFFSRREGASHYVVERFDYRRMHPVSLSGAVIGERIRVMEGDRLAEMISPGAESWLDAAEDTIKAINDQIRRARRA